MSEAVEPAVLVMARAPIAGRAKTRLEPMLGRRGCARLQAELIKRSAEWAGSVAGGSAFIAYDPPRAGDLIAALVPDGIRMFEQVGGHLGERLAAASDHVLSRHDGPLLVIGTDAPSLSRSHAQAALAKLAEGAHACLGPAADGGYYMVALSHPEPDLFAIAPSAWGGPEVLELTLAAARDAGIAVAVLDLVEQDLDTPDDARALLAGGGVPPDIASILRRAA